MKYDDSAVQTDIVPGLFHSRYAPKREAERHLDATLSGRHPSVIIIAGGGINYLASVAQERFPKACIVSLQPCTDFVGQELFSPALSWNPSSATSLHDILAIAFSENRLGAGVAVVSWPPVMAHYKVMADAITLAIREGLESASSDAATSGYWASRWLHNCIRFMLSARHSASLLPGTSPIILACAGPSLSKSLPGMLAMRDDVALWALASAVPALLNHGLVPDLVISTDPGFWNGAHLRQAFERKLPVALPPSSYAPSQLLERADLIALDTGLSFESSSLRAIGFSGLHAVASGSSAGTALRLALTMTNACVAIAGFDLAAEGHKDHASPYAFETIDVMSEHRLLPSYSARANRVLAGFPNTLGSWRSSRAFSVYAHAIRIPQADVGRVIRLGGSPVETNIPRGRLDDLSGKRGKKPSILMQESVCHLSLPDRRQASATMLTALADQAIACVYEALAESRPVPYEASLLWKALAPRASAPFLARAARAEASASEAQAIDASVRLAAGIATGIATGAP